MRAFAPSHDDLRWPTLRDLIAPGPVERGLYFLEASADAASRVQDRIVDLLWWDSVAMPGAMPARLSAWFSDKRGPVSHRSHRRHSRIGSMFWIDTGRTFNTAALMSQARLRGLEAARVARAIHVQNPVGAVGYLDALERVPNAALCALGETERQAQPTVFARAENDGPDGIRPPNSIWWTPLVVITDLLGPIADPRLSESERSRVSLHILEQLNHLRERAVVLALTTRAPIDPLMAAEFLRLGTRVVADRRDAEMPALAAAGADAWS